MILYNKHRSHKKDQVTQNGCIFGRVILRYIVIESFFGLCKVNERYYETILWNRTYIYIVTDLKKDVSNLWCCYGA
jgi:hypothetical protein